MKKAILLCLLFVAIMSAKTNTPKVNYKKTTLAKHQLMPKPIPHLETKVKGITTFTLPERLPSYNGTYEPISASHFFYPNKGQIRYDNTDLTSARDVLYYTQFTFPRKFIFENNTMAFVTSKPDASNGGTIRDSINRIDLEYIGRNKGLQTMPLDTQTICVLNYFLASCGGSITNIQGHGAIATQGLYKNIDLVYTSNGAGIRIFFVVYPGGNPNDIEMKFTGAKSSAYASGKLKFTTNFDGFSFDEAEAYNVYYAPGNPIVTTATTSGSSWVSVGPDTYKINPGSYDANAPLIILYQSN
jgi:hypothetical protein